jgi:hypothetical protein
MCPIYVAKMWRYQVSPPGPGRPGNLSAPGRLACARPASAPASRARFPSIVIAIASRCAIAPLPGRMWTGTGSPQYVCRVDTVDVGVSTSRCAAVASAGGMARPADSPPAPGGPPGPHAWAYHQASVFADHGRGPLALPPEKDPHLGIPSSPKVAASRPGLTLHLQDGSARRPP